MRILKDIDVKSMLRNSPVPSVPIIESVDFLLP